MNYQYYTLTHTISLPQDKRIVLVGGCFDILHFGHIQFLEKARGAGDYLIVALEPDERITQHKNRLPIHTQQKRVHNLLALRYVDHVILLPVLQGFDDYLQLVQSIKPHIIAVTSNDPQMTNKQKQADTINAQLVIVNNRIAHLSSTAIYQQSMNE
ncbi:MAG TPA: adenylyltransferase/cytidyltransferase family protein [Candidatus Babeliales bacterium]|nr:adenylyltransferase/cytidyltransferase family protein [Candidatus Babeliales bacterium]